ncbi:MAG: prolipoprotein diacylglyceryl transferase [Bacillota bacterium]|nr:prolipoprotein diacylglyceryl transferase [Bacillota bacterium]
MNPVAFTVFGIDVRWYGILIAAGMLIGIFMTYKRAPKFGIDPERIIDAGLFVIPAAIIGARFWYVVFNWDMYQGDIMKILNVRMGGLAFHGGLIFALITAALLCRKWSVNPWNLMDLAMPAVALGQAVGRWGNYINKEAYGVATNLPWAIEVNGEMVHPTFLYESIWCLLLCILLIKISPDRKFTGQITLLYGILYSLERFFVEGLRIDSLYFMGFRTAQLVSLAAIIACSAVYYIKKKKL